MGNQDIESQHSVLVKVLDKEQGHLDSSPCSDGFIAVFHKLNDFTKLLGNIKRKEQVG